MGEPIFAMIVPLSGGGPVDPGFGNRPIHHPGHPDHGLPSGGYPSQPIYHPGHPSHGLPSQPGRPSQPIYHPGHPSHGLPAHPDQSLPIDEQIDNALPEGEEVPPEAIQLPDVPPEYSDKVIVAVKTPDGEWTVKAYDDATAGTPLPPTAAPKKG